MADDSKTEIAQWLKQGLDAYGDGEISTAIRCWRKVVAADPENVEALDFLQSADRRQFPRGDDDGGKRGGPGDRAEVAHQDVVGAARRLIASEQFEESLELLQSAAEASEFNLELQATIELVRGNLFASYRQFVGDLAGVPTLVADPAELTKFNLPKDAGFLLSLVDGVTNLENIVAVSGMDSFEALRTTKNLIEVGIVSMQR